MAGAEGVVVHLRGDRRHIQERDVRLLRQLVKTPLILEMAATENAMEVALSVRPDMVTFVPEKGAEVTTEGGLDLGADALVLAAVVERLRSAAIGSTLFINPEEADVREARRMGVDAVEVHTGYYAEAAPGRERVAELARVVGAVKLAHSLGLKANVGHGLDYHNVGAVAQVRDINEYSIGHSIVARAVFVGFPRAVREMAALIKAAGG
jgi:pyridoxine 5-phosphate synthase